MAMLEDAINKGEADYFSAAYFTFVAMICIYDLTRGMPSPSIFVIGPIFYSIVVLSVISFIGIPILALKTHSNLKNNLPKAKYDIEDWVDKISALFISLGAVAMPVFAIVIIYSMADPSYLQLLFEPAALLLILLSIMQVGYFYSRSAVSSKLSSAIDGIVKYSVRNGLLCMAALIIAPFVFVLFLGLAYFVLGVAAAFSPAPKAYELLNYKGAVDGTGRILTFFLAYAGLAITEAKLWGKMRDIGKKILFPSR